MYTNSDIHQIRIRDVVPDAVLRVKGDKIKMLQKEIRKAMVEAAGDDEKISAGLGGRLII